MAEDRLEERFADFLGEQTVALPRLAARPEDLRALALHHLTRIGLRERKKPIGIDASALEWLLEHDWPGNETEFESVLIRAALAMEGSSDVLTRQDLLRGGFTRR
jgi:DNA-binding NtrC family response regulator